MRYRRSLLLALATMLAANTLQAQGPVAASVPAVSPAAAPALPQDSTRRPSPALGRPELKGFATTFALGGFAYIADQGLRDAVRRPAVQSNDGLHALKEFGNHWGQPGVVSLGWVMYGGGLLTKRPALAASGLRAIEAITVSGLVTAGLKATFGRRRPYASPDDPSDFQFARGFRDSESGGFAMPSGHATAAFAFATAVTREVADRAPRHARWVGAVTYGAAGLTAYARMHDDKHWFSDVVVGAGVGTVTALAIHRWHATRPDDPIDRFFLRPVLAPSADGQLRLGLSATFR